MFLSNTLDPSGCSNRLFGLEEDELEILRLKTLFQENILKVEKENMEIIKKKMSDPKESEKKENKPKRIIRSNTRVETANLSKRLVYTKLSENKNEPESKCPNMQTESVCHNATSECKFSAIHFLNHFQSSFISSKIPTKDKISSKKYMPCAIPLAPPMQKSSVLDERLQPNNIKTRLSTNAVLHHVISEETPKKLTVQVLPSITIHENKPNYCINHSNVVTEVVRKKDYFEGDGIKTTILPAISAEERSRISSINLNSRNFTKISSSDERSKLSDIIQQKPSVFTQTSCKNIAVPQVPDWSENIITVKENLKKLVKEILEEFPLRSQGHHVETNTEPTILKEQDVLSPVNDCELDSFLGNVDLTPRLSSDLIDENISKCSAHTQSSGHMPATTFNEEQLKYLIQEVISKLQHNASYPISFIKNENKMEQKNQKAHKEIQTCTKDCQTIKDIKSFAPKAIQVSLREDPFVKCDSAEAETSENSPQVVTKNLFENTTGDTVAKSYEASSKLESILNCIYERFCVDRVATPSNPQPVTPSYVESVTTREVSVQFNPVSTLTKGTCTSDVMRVDANQQCSLLSSALESQKHISHSFVQTEVLVPEPLPIPPAQTKMSTYVQCELPVVMDSCVQTMEHLNVFPPSENSANTSVSTTPVSDIMFLDDMLSEGEVPCNLRLFSAPDKTGGQSSRIDTDVSCNSERENDYSLSEGEIPPKYLQEINLHQSSIDDNRFNDYSNTVPSYPHYSTVLLGRSPGEIYPESRSHSAIERGFCSSSSLSEGEVRSCSVSEGEVPYYTGQGLRPSSSQSFNASWRDMPNPSFHFPLSSHRSNSSLEADPRELYSWNVSTDEPVRGASETYLRTVTEEK